MGQWNYDLSPGKVIIKEKKSTTITKGQHTEHCAKYYQHFTDEKI